MLAVFFTPAWRFFFDPPGHPFYEGNVYGNLVAIAPSAIIVTVAGYAWKRSRWWPLIPLQHAVHGLHVKLDAHHKELHARLDAHERLYAEHSRKLDRLLAARPSESLQCQTDLPVEETT
jgi:hypothetical protein